MNILKTSTDQKISGTCWGGVGEIGVKIKEYNKTTFFYNIRQTCFQAKEFKC